MASALLWNPNVRLDALARLLGTALAVPGINIGLVLDALIGLVAGIGGLITTLTSN
jgi:hypothetical protein